MVDKTFTDVTYDLVEQLEGRGRWLPALAACLLFAIVGIMTNIFNFAVILGHSKGAVFDMGYMGTLLISINLIACCLFAIVGGAQFAFFRGFRRRVRELEELEDTIYREVLKR